MPVSRPILRRFAVACSMILVSMVWRTATMPALAQQSGPQSSGQGIAAREDPFVTRSMTFKQGDTWSGNGICYGPFRDGQAPGQREPSAEEIREDLHLIQQHWSMLRIYGSDNFARTICQVIRDDRLPLKVMAGAWVATVSDDAAAAANQSQVDQVIALANDFPAVVSAVCIGNECQVFWSSHKLDPDKLIQYIRQARKQTAVPVTVADDFPFWTADESQRVAAEIDFIVTHIYAMWHSQPLEAAIEFTRGKLAEVRAKHGGKLIVLGEAGWATDKASQGEQAERLQGEAGEDAQARFYADFRAWTAKERIPYFYFSAFDENWKGSPDPHDAEKHWGLFRADRTAKQAIAGTTADARKD